MKKRLLLQTCCGPCSTGCIEHLLSDYEITLFFFNPNIQPEEEFIKRLSAQRQVCKHFHIPMIEINYNTKVFNDAIKGHEDEPEGSTRCSICYALRLEEAAKWAKEYGYDCFTSTLSVSPYKDAKMVNELGKAAGERHGVTWIDSNFNEVPGYERCEELTKQLGLYEQSYCGCIPSIATAV